MNTNNIYLTWYQEDEIAKAMEAYRQMKQISRENFVTTVINLKLKEWNNGNNK